jgi:hypothetical protein
VVKAKAPETKEERFDALGIPAELRGRVNIHEQVPDLGGQTL